MLTYPDHLWSKEIDDFGFYYRCDMCLQVVSSDNINLLGKSIDVKKPNHGECIERSPIRWRQNADL